MVNRFQILGNGRNVLVTADKAVRVGATFSARDAQYALEECAYSMPYAYAYITPAIITLASRAMWE